jgi:hypothetical protein
MYSDIPKFDISALAPRSRPSTVIDREERLVRFHASALKHGHVAEITAFFAAFSTYNDIASFSAAYTITANEPIQPFTGNIRFEVRLES